MDKSAIDAVQSIANKNHISEPKNPTNIANALRTPPHNIEAEMALLGSILANNKSHESVAEYLQKQHFIDPAHQKIFDVIKLLIEQGKVADPITLANHFEQDNELEKIGGKAYLARLASAMAPIIDIKDYGQLIFDLYLRREIIDIGENMVNKAYKVDIEEQATHHIEQAEQKLYQLAEAGTGGEDFKTLGNMILSAIDTAEIAFKRDSHITGVTTGLKDLDKKLGGLHPSDLLILAGRPSMGKTALATKIAYEAAAAFEEKFDKDNQPIPSEGGRVAFFSLEMSAEQLALRLLSEKTKIGSDRIRRGDIQAQDFEKFVEASQRLSHIPLYIDDSPGLTVGAIRNRARRLKRQKGLDMVIIDYLQLVQGSNPRSQDNRVQVVSEITRGLKILAKELDVPVIALSQLSRGPEQRDDKRPQLSDLRESGSIEQDADAVMFVFREEYYLSREQPPEGTEKHLDWQANMAKVHNVAEVIIAKQRHGPIGTVKLFFDGAHTTFEDYTPPSDYGG